VTDAPPTNSFPKGIGLPPYHCQPHVYEIPKRVSKPRVNKHPHGYYHLTGTSQTTADQNTDLQTLAKSHQQLLDLVQKWVQTTDLGSKNDVAPGEPSKVNKALDSHQP